jgi:hypothetical protein
VNTSTAVPMEAAKEGGRKEEMKGKRKPTHTVDKLA